MSSEVIDYRAFVVYEDGSESDIFKVRETGCGFSRDIPEGFSIVGITGQCKPGDMIRYLGFIVAKFDV